MSKSDFLSFLLSFFLPSSLCCLRACDSLQPFWCQRLPVARVRFHRKFVFTFGGQHAQTRQRKGQRAFGKRTNQALVPKRLSRALITFARWPRTGISSLKSSPERVRRASPSISLSLNASTYIAKSRDSSHWQTKKTVQFEAAVLE